MFSFKSTTVSNNFYFQGFGKIEEDPVANLFVDVLEHSVTKSPMSTHQESNDTTNSFTIHQLTVIVACVLGILFVVVVIVVGVMIVLIYVKLKMKPAQRTRVPFRTSETLEGRRDLEIGSTRSEASKLREQETVAPNVKFDL